MHEKSGGRTRREKGKIETAGRRRDRHETFDLRPPHQKLHPDPGAKRDSGDPAGPRLGADGLGPVESCCRVRQFALAVIEGALGASDAAKVKPQHGKATFGKSVIEIVDDLVVHRPAELRMRVQDDRDRRASDRRRMKSAFDAAARTVEHDLGHAYSTKMRLRVESGPRRSGGFSVQFDVSHPEHFPGAHWRRLRCA